MSAVHCPGCRRRIDLSEDEMQQQVRVECAQCGKMFRVRAPLPLTTLYTKEEEAPSVPVLPVPSYTAPRPRSRLPLVLAVSVGPVLLLLCCGGGLLLPHVPHPPELSGKRIVQPGPAPTKSVGADDPYAPDCAIIRAWLKQHQGDVEVASWGWRTISNDRDLGGHVTLSCRFRRKGEWKTQSGFFIIGPGDVVESSTITD